VQLVTNLQIARYHQQPLSSNDPGPFSSNDTSEGWCTAASLYMVLHSLVPNLPQRLHDLDPSWKSWRASTGVPAVDLFFYDKDTTYNVQEFLQDRYLKRLAGIQGVGYSEIKTMAQSAASDLGVSLQVAEVPIAEMRDRLAQGWLAIVNNSEWSGHYFVVVWYESGADPSVAEQRYYYVLDPKSIDSGNADIKNNLHAKLTARFRKFMQSRQQCGSVDCSSDLLGIYVLNGKGINAVLKTDQLANKAVLMFKRQ
jgi:hypothetical protein